MLDKLFRSDFCGSHSSLRSLCYITVKITIFIARRNTRLHQQARSSPLSGTVAAGYSLLCSKQDSHPSGIATNGTFWACISLLAAARYILWHSIPSTSPIGCGQTPDEAHILVFHFLF